MASVIVTKERRTHTRDVRTARVIRQIVQVLARLSARVDKLEAKAVR